MKPESCEQCGFDNQFYDRSDTISSQRVVPRLLAASFDGMSPELLAQRPDATTFSIAEYVDHVREVAFGNRFAIESALGQSGIDLGSAPNAPLPPEPRDIDVAAALQAAMVEYEAIGELLATLTDDQWGATAVVDGDELSVDWFARHVVHDGLHHVADVGRIRAGAGFGATPGTGAVTQINVSNGGVPKQPVAAAVAGPTGVEGDSQADRKHHGRPVQAVCLWSADVIAALVAEGHPIAAGNAGENVTVAGVDWASLRPGSRLNIGEVPMWITAHAIPCAKNAQWFSDRDFNRILHDRNPGSSRLYAIPLATGEISVGDAVIVEP